MLEKNTCDSQFSAVVDVNLWKIMQLEARSKVKYLFIFSSAEQIRTAKGLEKKKSFSLLLMSSMGYILLGVTSYSSSTIKGES